ncbi:DUF4135 domain-containing protein [Pseudonocardia sp. CA-107938]|uniref:DUF4135 domain-containing protein n=1 Tax=Pseudonocardia sp. CA-107938 TaxID=3240021 RepID=UPI003D924703
MGAGQLFLAPLENAHATAVRRELDTPAAAWFDLAIGQRNVELAGSVERVLRTYLAALRAVGEEAPADLRELAGDPGARPEVLRTFGALADLIEVRMRNRAAAAAELALRLQADAAELGEWLGLGRPFAPAAITLGLGDSHDGARAVAAVTDAGGARLAYRPRPVDAMVAFGRFCTAVGEREVRMPAVLPRAGYGWTRWVEPRPCTDRPAYARRLGRIAAVVWVLGGTDLHRENVVGAGSVPMLVDVETPLGTDPVLIPDEPGAWAVHDSAVSTSMLPGARPFPGAPRADVISAFLATAPAAEQEQLHAALLDGFRSAAGNIADQHDRLSLDAFRGVPLRIIVRPTYRYAELLQKADHPALLSDRGARERFFGQLALDGSRPLPDLVSAEVDALLAGDVPLVEVAADAVEAWCAGRPVLRLDRSPLDRAAARIAALTEDAVAVESDLVADCLLADRFDRLPQTMQVPPAVPRTGDGDLVEAALAAGHALRRRARRSPAGISWLDVSSVAGTDWHVGPVDESLYKGLAGIALACAELAARTGDERIAALRDDVVESWSRTPVPGALGAFAGVGGQLLAAALLGVDARVDAALAALAGAPDGSPAPDVHFGVAGAVLVLEAVRERLGGDRVDAARQRCAERLLALADAGGPWWHGPDGQGLAGFAHGSAGIVLALELLAADGWAGAREHAEALARWQEAQFVPAEGGWRDLRTGPAGPVTTTWCNGSSGIGTALAVAVRLGIGEVARLRQVAEATARRPGGAVLNVCDGDLGVAAFLLDAGVATGEDEWVAAGRRIAGHVAAQVLAGGDPATATARLDRRSGLMNGYAGMMLGLLHAADPRSVPSVPAFGLNLVEPKVSVAAPTLRS